MTIAEKLTKIADNEQKVYDAGYERGYHDGEIVGGGSYDEGFADGKQAEYDAFWDVYQNNGNRTDYSFAFAGNGGNGYSSAKGVWTNETFKPKYPLIASKGANYMFRGSCIENVDCDIDISQCTTVTYMFYYNYLIKTIRKLIISENVKMTAPFEQCSALENITFEGVIGNDINFQWSTLLTRASIESIVSHLSDTASGKTLTLSKLAADNAFPCPMEDGNGGWINVGCGGNSEWLELVATKSNWQISLV